MLNRLLLAQVVRQTEDLVAPRPLVALPPLRGLLGPPFSMQRLSSCESGSACASRFAFESHFACENGSAFSGFFVGSDCAVASRCASGCVAANRFASADFACGNHFACGCASDCACETDGRPWTRRFSTVPKASLGLVDQAALQPALQAEGQSVLQVTPLPTLLAAPLLPPLQAPLLAPLAAEPALPTGRARVQQPLVVHPTLEPKVLALPAAPPRMKPGQPASASWPSDLAHHQLPAEVAERPDRTWAWRTDQA